MYSTLYLAAEHSVHGTSLITCCCCGFRFVAVGSNGVKVEVLYSNISLAIALPAHEGVPGLLHLQLLQPVMVGSNAESVVQYKLNVSGDTVVLVYLIAE
jgi:nucleosome binding factor SPN SPT16 subunit